MSMNRPQRVKLFEDLARKFPPRCLHCDVVLPAPPAGSEPWPVCEKCAIADVIN